MHRLIQATVLMTSEDFLEKKNKKMLS